MCSVKCLRRVLLWCLLSNWISGKDLVASTVASSLCLPSGLNPEFRKNLSKAGESYPVGVVLADWSSAHVTSAVFEILIEEVLGYNIYVDPRSPASTLDGIYALIGCTTFMNAVDRGCTDRNAKLHMMSESWWQYYAGYYALAEEFHGEIPIEAGGMGYTGSDGVYVPKAILVEAENETGLALEYYKSYHPQWFKPWVYFGNVSDVDTSMVLPCHLVGHFTHNASTFVYWSKTGDDGGVTIVNNSYKVFCADGFFWRAAACRSSPWKCILFITAGDGWGARAVMDKATFLSMPLAIAVANSAVNYVTIPHFYKSLIYWWTPDATFMDLNPTKLVFPPYNAYEWNERQVYTTAGEETPLSKLISHDLEFLAPDIVKLLGSGTFDINAVNSMMAEQKGSGLSRKKVACNWLKANEERWRPWIPVETACSLGFGLYDETKDRFATLRAGATTCRACLPGTYSMKIVDSVGVTYVCEACPPGQQQRGAGAVVCEPCPLGTSKGYQSIENCAPCQAGKYQDQEGTLMCKDCPNSTTTVLLGVTMLSDCVCKEGTMDVNDAGQSTFAVSKECVECTEGIRCPDGATLKGLQVGQNVTGFSGPAILEGYFSWSKEPLSIYKCPEPFCPGGRPGTCQGGRLGPTCSECAAGMYWANDQCTVCEVPLKVTWFVAIVAAFVLMIAAYYGTDPRYRARATVKECMSIGTDLMLAFVQNLGILSAVQVPWPGELRVLFEFSSIFVLNLKAMGFNCASHGDMQQYVLCAGVFLAVTGTLPTLGALSHFLPSLKRRDLSWNFYKTICVTGKFLQSGFTTLCNIGMVPFMCFLHPNGTHSILKYPNTFCNSSEHWAMQIGGTVVLLLAMTHFIVCAWACHQAPVWSRSTPHRLVGIGFLLANYRPSTWWFGLTLLIRGPLLSFPAVVATNSPGINLTMMFFVLQISFALQLYFLPWKAPILNIVDATATSLFLMLLAISLHLEDANRSLVVLELVGVGVYYVSIGVIACVWFVSLALLAWQRCFAARREPKIVNLGALPDANDVLSAIELVTMSLAQKTDKQKEFLLKKMSFEISAYDLRIVGQALDILFDDCELRPVSQSAAGATARLAAKRMSQMTRRSITYLRPSLQKELEEEAQEVHADTRIVGAAGALEEQPEGVDAEVEVRQVHSFNSSISSFRDDAL